MRVSKWQNFNFWVNYPFNSLHKPAKDNREKEGSEIKLDSKLGHPPPCHTLEYKLYLPRFGPQVIFLSVMLKGYCSSTESNSAPGLL